MQVLPSFCTACIFSAPRGVCFWWSMASQLWQLRHSCESLAIIVAHTCSASSARLASNFSGVPIVPRRWWYSSLDAWLLRHSFGPYSLGTWQSDQIARTPEALR